MQIPNMAELSGFLHDLGKWTPEFDRYLQQVVVEGRRISPYIDHSTAGARYLNERYGGKAGDQPSIEKITQQIVVEIVGMAILSHHSGLQDFVDDDGGSDFIRRVREKELPYYREVVAYFETNPENASRVERLFAGACREMQQILIKGYEMQRQCPEYSILLGLSFVMKALLSCLVDADRTNTRMFEERERRKRRTDVQHFFAASYRHVMEQVDEWKRSGGESHIDALRSEMSERCDQLASRPSGIYTLSIPTGGGKTFASLRYALKHALEATNRKERIIYVVPYTTILEQNAAAVRRIIRNETGVLEHHGNVIDDQQLDQDFDYYGQPLHKQLQLARDNWDYPVLFTTMVQFLDVFYSRGTRKTRRLHNLMNSVIIFDEVQAVPFQHYHLFNEAVNFLHEYGGSSILLCTATQPSVGDMHYPLRLSADPEMVASLDQVVAAFERVRFCLEEEALGGMDHRKVCDYTQRLYDRHRSLLVILNTKKQVQQLFEAMQEAGVNHVYHLSTWMCPAHRTTILNEVRERLAAGEPVLCISTQLIEAGVDISFQAVLRALAGLDSIAQAAGRCNRHGESARGFVYLVNVTDENLDRLPEIKHGKLVTMDHILRDSAYRDRLLHPDTIRLYYQYYYHKLQQSSRMIHSKVGRELIELIDTNAKLRDHQQTFMPAMYKTLETHFQAIDSPTTTVLVPYGRGREIIVALNEEVRDLTLFGSLLREAQSYSVNVYSQTLLELSRAGLIYTLYDKSIYYLDEQAYSEEQGLVVDGGGSASLYAY